MKISQFKQMVRSFAQGAEKGMARIPILVEGEMGIGKSQAVQQVAKELGFTYVDLRLAEQEPGDLIGIPRGADGVTVWDRPSWIPEKNVKLMLALEEVNRAPIDVQQAIFQALTEYKIHTNDLPTITQIVACVNPQDSIYHVSELDPAFLTRCFKVGLEPDCDEWLSYMTETGGDDRVIKFIALHRGEFLCKPKPDGACPLPRTWSLLSSALQFVTDDRLLYDLGVGFVGKEMAVDFRKFCDKEYKRPVTAKEILSDYKKVAKRLADQRSDETYATVTDLVLYLGSKEKPKITKPMFANLVDFLLTIKAEWKVMIIQKLPPAMLSDLSQIPELIDAVAGIINETNKVANPNQ